MSNLPSNAIQKAIYDALTGDAVLMGKIEGVFDSVQQEQNFPYLVLGEDPLVPADSHTADGVMADINVHCWSRGQGKKENKDILGDVYRVLHNANLTVTGFHLVRLQFSGAGPFVDIDPDGQTYHGVMRFEMHVTN